MGTADPVGSGLECGVDFLGNEGKIEEFWFSSLVSLSGRESRNAILI